MPTGEASALARHNAMCGSSVGMSGEPPCKVSIMEIRVSLERGNAELMAKPFMTLVLVRARGGQPPLPAQTFYDICKPNKNNSKRILDPT